MFHFLIDNGTHQGPKIFENILHFSHLIDNGLIKRLSDNEVFLWFSSIEICYFAILFLGNKGLFVTIRNCLKCKVLTNIDVR